MPFPGWRWGSTSPMNTEVIKGTATGIRESIHVSGDKSGVSTRHHTLFKVGTTTVIFVSGGPPVIGEGDRLVVAGRRRGQQMLIADAYHNQTAGVIGNAGLWGSLVGMLVSLAMGAAFTLYALLSFPPGVSGVELFWRLFLGGFGVISCCVGFYSMYRWLRIRDAVRVLRGR
jgi:hypothetical protein